MSQRYMAERMKAKAAYIAELHHRSCRRPLWKDIPSWFLIAEDGSEH
jgi:hypothetical protein